MKLAMSLALMLSVFAGAAVEAQRRTITNSELEKHKQKRLQAEQDYRDNYDRMGFPSPEELERQLEKSREERFELAARLAAERLERERLAVERDRVDLERESLALQREAMQAASAPDTTYYGGGFYGFGYPGSFGGKHFGRFRGPGFLGGRVDVGNGIPIVNYYGAPRFPRPILRTPARPRFGGPGLIIRGPRR